MQDGANDPNVQIVEPRIVEIKLEPLHVRGELIVDDWWQGPEVKARPFVLRHLVFIVTFVLPVALACVYYVLLASNQYVSESRFIVRTPSTSAIGNLASLMQDQKMSRASDETYAIVEYIDSMDAMDALAKKVDLAGIFNKGGADLLYRYPPFGQRPSKERMLSRYQRAVSVNVTSDSGIAVLRTMAFTPEDALKMNQGLLDSAEGLVNVLNTRAYGDSLKLATKVVADYRHDLNEAENKLVEFRNASRLVDPNKESAAEMSELAVLSSKLADAQVQLNQVSEVTASSPQIRSIKERVSALVKQIEASRNHMAGGSSSTSSLYAQFDQLTLDQVLAAKGLEAAVTHLVNAQQDATRQSYYLQTVVKPGEPDLAHFPHRILMILAIAAVSFAVYRMVNAFARNVMEHAS